jgi:hypothetical protein
VLRSACRDVSCEGCLNLGIECNVSEFSAPQAVLQFGHLADWCANAGHLLSLKTALV